MFKLYKKNKEIINYLVAGFLAMLVSISSYEIFKNIFHIHYVISNILSWIFAVIFAYFVNRKFVFNSKNNNKIKEFISFVKYRVLSLLIETLLIYVLVDLIKLNSDISKIIGQVVVIILNYIFSKFFTFKNVEK